MYTSQTTQRVNHPPLSADSLKSNKAYYSNENQPQSQQASIINTFNNNGLKASTSSYATKNAMAEISNDNNANQKSSFAKIKLVKRENELIGAWESDINPLTVHRVIKISSTQKQSQSPSCLERLITSDSKSQKRAMFLVPTMTPVMKTRFQQHKNEVMQQLNPDLPPHHQIIYTDISQTSKIIAPKDWQNQTLQSQTNRNLLVSSTGSLSRQTIFQRNANFEVFEQPEVLNGGDRQKEVSSENTKFSPIQSEPQEPCSNTDQGQSLMPTLNKMEEYQDPKKLAPQKISPSYRTHQQYKSYSPLINKIQQQLVIPQPGAIGKKLTVSKKLKPVAPFGKTLTVGTRPYQGAHSRQQLLDFQSFGTVIVGGGGFREIIPEESSINPFQQEESSELDPKQIEKLKNQIGRPLGHHKQESLGKESDILPDPELQTKLIYQDYYNDHHDDSQDSGCKRICCNPALKEKIQQDMKQTRRKKVHETAQMLVRAWQMRMLRMIEMTRPQDFVKNIPPQQLSGSIKLITPPKPSQPISPLKKINLNLHPFIKIQQNNPSSSNSLITMQPVSQIEVNRVPSLTSLLPPAPKPPLVPTPQSQTLQTTIIPLKQEQEKGNKQKSLLLEDFTKKGLKINDNLSRNLVTDFKSGSQAQSKTSNLSTKQINQLNVELPSLSLMPANNHVVVCANSNRAPLNVKRIADLKNSALTSDSLLQSTISKAPKLFSTLQHNVSVQEEGPLIPTSRFKYITTNIPDEFFKPQKSKRKKVDVQKAILVTNDQVTLNHAHSEQQNAALLPPKSNSGVMQGTHSTFPVKKRKNQQASSQKTILNNTFEMGCIESRKLVYPDNRNWIGQNLNNELIY